MKKLPQFAAVVGSILLTTFTLNVHAGDGLVRLKSVSSVTDTADKLEAVLRAKGMTVFTRINHAQGAKSVGLSLMPTEVVIFGNPKIGTLLMNCSPQVAIDLPQKALIQQDKDGQVWLSYNDPQYLAERHDIQGCEQPLKKVSGALNKFAQKATQ